MLHRVCVNVPVFLYKLRIWVSRGNLYVYLKIIYKKSIYENQLLLPRIYQKQKKIKAVRIVV